MPKAQVHEKPATGDDYEPPAFLAKGFEPCDVHMLTDFLFDGGSFNRLTFENNRSVFNESTGVIAYTFRGRERRMSIHCAQVAGVSLK